ncbi:CHAP domain-containing protein [Pseudooceanicola sp. C21-150M6]|uniref:CHAP domain-containing protein n=1 Tax=Pseudooceanicola sp. C21-150M6 TaxID=3434355 RepID=UPI003D7F7076
MSVKRASQRIGKAGLATALLCLAAACSNISSSTPEGLTTIDPDRMSFAISEARSLRARGARVWCVPFARNVSGVEIRGNANTWWGQAAGAFDRSKKPEVGAVMAFAATRGMPMGHVAVVSEVRSDREILIDHANWHRNQISLGMSVIDVSDKNDWSRVKVESNPGQYGSVYPINGFILPGTT